MRWFDRLIGIVSTLVLARLLAPEDLGIIAMASLVIGLLDVLLDLGVNVALVQNRNAEQAHYNTAWTLRLIQSTIAAVAVVSVAPLAGQYFGDSRVVPVLQIMGIGLILVGVENIGIVSFQKEMRFGAEFKYLFVRRIAGVITTLVAAWFLRSYWALVIGALTGRSFGVLLSFAMHPMRPRLSLEKFKEIFAVSQWLLVRSVGAYLNVNLHKLIVGNRADAAIMGGYNLADEISSMPSTELLGPLNRVLFPAFVQARENLAELKRLFLLAQGIQSLIALPAGIGLALIADEAVLVLLGEKWTLSVPFVQLLAIANAATAITTSGGYMMITIGKVKDVAILTWVNVAIFLLAAFLLFPSADAIGLAWLRLAGVMIGLILTLVLLLNVLPDIKLTDMVASVARPIMAVAVMAGVVTLTPWPMGLTALQMLTVKVGAGMLSYSVVVFLLWWMAGKPQGAERYVIDKAARLISGAKDK